jgi:hypothetical protein
VSKQYPVTGLQQLDNFLSYLPKNLQKGAYRAGLTAAAKPIRDEARLRAKGRIARAVVTGSSRQNQDGTFSVRIYVDERKPGGFLGYFQEYGVKPHYIARTGKGEGRVTVRKAVEGGQTVGGVIKIGDDFVSGVVSHPGHAASPFLRPALDLRADDAVKAFADRIRAFLESKTGFAAPLPKAA